MSGEVFEAGESWMVSRAHDQGRVLQAESRVGAKLMKKILVFIHRGFSSLSCSLSLHPHHWALTSGTRVRMIVTISGLAPQGSLHILP